MGVYFVHPDLTLSASHPLALRFYEACCSELQEHIDVTIIRTDSALASASPSAQDAVVFFCRFDDEYDEAVLDLLETATKHGSEVVPVAISMDCRRPPASVSKSQSFDVVEQLRHRCLTEGQVETVAMALARTIMARLQPTLSKDRMHLFISHRRLDGEDIAAALCAQFRVRAEQAFRDLIDIRVGEDAQEVIEHNLRACDAVVFVDTPKTGESEWVERELSTALSLNVPIVWLRVGPSAPRIPLKVMPSTEKPHFELPDLNVADVVADPSLVDQVIHKAFEISRQAARRVFQDIRRIKALARRTGATLTEIDRRGLLFTLQVPRRGFKYRQRPMTHLVQFFGRWPKPDDIDRFSARADSGGAQAHVVYDAEVLLAPIPPQLHHDPEEKVLFVDSCDEYVHHVESYFEQGTIRSTARRRGLIISGAFPDCEPDHQQHVTDAVHAFAQAVLQRSGTVIFGGHPTFQHLIFDLAKRERATDFKSAVHLYLSRFFVTDESITEYQRHASVVATDVVDKDRAKSLTAMRRAMINDTEALALVAIGGKTKAGGHPPGVDEEIEIARAAGLPVFLIGSVGGRSAELATEYANGGWVNNLNGLTPEDNRTLLVNVDYKVLATMVLDKLGL